MDDELKRLEASVAKHCREVTVELQELERRHREGGELYRKRMDLLARCPSTTPEEIAKAEQDQAEIVAMWRKLDDALKPTRDFYFEHGGEERAEDWKA